MFRPWVALFDERRARHLSTGEQVVEPCGRLERMALRVALCREAHGAREHTATIGELPEGWYRYGGFEPRSRG